MFFNALNLQLGCFLGFTLTGVIKTRPFMVIVP